MSNQLKTPEGTPKPPSTKTTLDSPSSTLVSLVTSRQRWDHSAAGVVSTLRKKVTALSYQVTSKLTVVVTSILLVLIQTKKSLLKRLLKDL